MQLACFCHVRQRICAELDCPYVILEPVGLLRALDALNKFLIIIWFDAGKLDLEQNT